MYLPPWESAFHICYIYPHGPPLASAVTVTWPAEVLAFGRAVSDTFHSAYITHFFDKATFLVNCL